MSEPTPGVTWQPRWKRWQARVTRGGRQVWLGHHDTVEEAAAAIDEYDERRAAAEAWRADYEARVHDLLTDIATMPDGPPPHEMEGAICAQSDPDQWFQETSDNLAAAKRLCRTCPALEACREWGIEHPYEHGVWGGLTTRQRLRIYQQRKEQAS